MTGPAGRPSGRTARRCGRPPPATPVTSTETSRPGRPHQLVVRGDRAGDLAGRGSAIPRPGSTTSASSRSRSLGRPGHLDRRPLEEPGDGAVAVCRVPPARAAAVGRHASRGAASRCAGLRPSRAPAPDAGVEGRVHPSELASGATDLINEAATSKITGEEERYSDTDLVVFGANVAGRTGRRRTPTPVRARRPSGGAQARSPPGTASWQRRLRAISASRV